MSEKSAIVIGAGIGGIAIAIRLAAKGLKVKVLEANSYAGGKLSETIIGNYRFDAGPSLFTLPELVDELFSVAGKNASDYFRYQRLVEICRYFYEDGTQITAFSEPQKFAEEIAIKTGVDAKKVLEHLGKSKEMYKLTDKLFLQSSLHKLSSYLQPHAIKAFFNLPKLKTSSKMHSVNSKQFSDERITQLFDRYATYNGSNPYQAPATLNIIPHLEYYLGAYFPEGGMYSITQSLVKLAEETGVIFHFNSTVEEIVVENKKVTGVKTSDYFYPSEIVISNVDISTTYKRLLPTQKHPIKLLNQEKSSSGIVFYWGMKNVFPELGLHNIFFSKNYKEEFDFIFKKKQAYSDPTIYLNISSKHQTKDAPDGCENWFTMINVPNNQGQDWEQIISEARENIIQKLNRLLKKDIRQYIECESVLDPRSIETKTGSAYGALYGNSSNNKFAAFLRHANFSSDIENLYFCGGSVHPGGGIPLCLFSAKIVSDLISKR